MKIGRIIEKKLYHIVFTVIAAVSFCSCDPTEPQEQNLLPYNRGIFILNEGLFNMNNTTLSFLDFSDYSVSSNVFLTANNRGLGDTGSDLQLYGNKLYAVINLSERVEVIDPNTSKSLASLSLAGREPRSIAFYQNFAFISCYDGSVVKIDTASLSIVDITTAGANPEGICVANHKLYVANSGGLNYPNYNNTVSVFQLPSLTFIKDITVEINPYKLKKDERNYLYLISRGNYNDIPYTLQRINTQTDDVDRTYEVPILNFDIVGNRAWLYHYDFSTLQSSFKVMDLVSETIVDETFISDNTQIVTPYCIAVNPENLDVYITDTYNYTVNGDILCFDKNGKLKFKKEVGLNPSYMVFRN